MLQAQEAYKAALAWYLDQGVTDALERVCHDKTKPVEVKSGSVLVLPPTGLGDTASIVPLQSVSEVSQHVQDVLKTVKTLEELKVVIAGFEGLSLKKTATNLVFSEGSPESSVMVIGDVPSAEDDRVGKPFQGQSGVLLDRITRVLGLDRASQEPEKGVYLTTILNWRPPGDRTVLGSEYALSLPFIRKHIALVNPRVLILCGSLAAQKLLQTDKSSSQLRGAWHQYKCEGADERVREIPARVIAHPLTLLNTPLQKRVVWAEMQAVQEYLIS